MVDVAELVIRGRAEGFDEANAKMRTTQAEAQKTEGAVENMGKSMSRVDAHTQNMTRALAAAETRTKAMALAGFNLGRQFTDVGVTMAMGMNPFMIAIQQGPQIIDAFQVAALQMGTTVRGAMVAMGAAIWTALAPLLPIIAAIAAAAAVGFGSFTLATRAAGKEIGDLTTGMGLTQDQLKKLEEQNVSTTTTMGDVWRGVGTTIKEGFFDLFGDQVDDIERRWNEFLDNAWKFVVTATKNIVGSFVGAFYAIRDTWRMIPSAVGDAAISAANLVVRGTENMINGAVRLLNGLIEKANAAAGAVGLRNFLPRLSPVDLAEFANPFMRAMTRMGRQGAESFGEGFASGSAFVERAAARLAENIEASGRARIQRALGDTSEAVRDVGSAADEAADKAERLVERLQRFERVQIQPLDIRVPDVVDPLIGIVEELRLIDGLARDAAYGMAEAFGDAGRAVGDALVALSSYQAISAQIALDAKEGRLTEAQAAREQANLQVRTYGDMANAAKGFFDEQSSGYKALQAVEQVYRAWQLATSVAAVAQGWLETGQSVAQAGVKASADTAAGGAKMFSQLGIYAFPLVGAMVAVMASLGARGGGSVATPTLPTTNDGTGAVLGDPTAQSNSIGKSVENAEKFWNRDLQMTNEMVRSLRAIENEIGSMTTLIAREIGVGGGFDTSGLGLGTSTSRSLFGLLSTTRTSSLVGQGLQLNAGTLANLIAQGVTGSLYQLVENSKTKSGFLGFGGGTTTWTTETRTPMDRELGMQLGRILDSLRTSVLTAAGTIGVEGAEATLNAMVLSLGRIDFTGLSSAEISEKLSAVFSAAGDQMVQAILPGLVNYQQAGEGLLETLTRLATTFTAVDTTLESMGMSFGAVGLGSLNARLRLVELSGGLEAFTESASFFVSEFLTEAQQIAPIQAAVSAELERLGLASNISRSQFADLVMGLDVSTEAGAQMYAALMALAPALDRVLDYQEELAGSTQNLSQLEAQRRELEIRLMEAQGRIAEALAARRADELAAMDESLRPLQLAIWAQQDLAAAAQELAATEAEAANQLASIAAQRRDMEIELLEAQGRATEALQARRDIELASLDATLRPLQLAIWAAQDAAAAQDELAQAQQEAADTAQRLAEQRADLEIQLLEATGHAAEALARQREIELAAIDASLRPLQEQVWAALDAAEAAEELAAAQEAEAEAARQLAEQRRDLEIRLMEATGNAAGALAARRADELAAMDETLRGLQQSVWAAQDAAAAAEAARQAREERQQKAIDAVNAARDALTASYEREAGALQETIDKFAGFGDSLRAFRKDLEGLTGAGSSYAGARSEFERVAALARTGNAEALGNLQGVSQTYLDAAMQNAGSALEYQRILASVIGAVDGAIGAADGQKSLAEQQLAALDAQVSGLITVNESVLSVVDAIDALNEALTGARRAGVRQFATGGVFGSPTYFDIGQMAEAGPEAIMPLTMTSAGLGVRAVNDNGSMDDLVAELRAVRAELADIKAATTQTGVNTGQMKRKMDRQELDGVYVRGAAPGDPVETVAA